MRTREEGGARRARAGRCGRVVHTSCPPQSCPGSPLERSRQGLMCEKAKEAWFRPANVQSGYPVRWEFPFPPPVEILLNIIGAVQSATRSYFEGATKGGYFHDRSRVMTRPTVPERAEQNVPNHPGPQPNSGCRGRWECMSGRDIHRNRRVGSPGAGGFTWHWWRSPVWPVAAAIL